MKILIDTNIFLDMFQKRQPFENNAVNIITACVKREIKGCVSSHSLCDMIYILRKDFSLQEKKAIIKFVCDNFEIISETKDDFYFLVNDEKTSDLEDCLQIKCAVKESLDYIITRNISDFSNSTIKAIEPSDFLKIIGYI